MAWFTLIGSAAAVASAKGIAVALRARGLREGPTGDAAEPGVMVIVGGSARRRDVMAAAAGGGRILVALVAGADSWPWQLLEAGADDVVTLTMPHGVDDLLARLDRWAAVDRIVESPQVRGTVVGEAPCWRAVLRQLVEIARFTASPVLLTGETGTGKEIVARLIHQLDTRPRRRGLVLVDCTTVVPSLSGSEFFGHVKGAFTGADAPRSGAFEMADGGTLFLDEVGELPTELQAALLRVVQEGAYKPVGGTRWQKTSFRLVAATNRDLRAEVEAARFRSDLYFRLAAVTVLLPPLRDRIQDVVPLFRHFLAEAIPEPDAPDLDSAVADFLQRRAYPGNVRDLRQLAVRVATRHVGAGPITPGDIPPEDRPAGNDADPAPSGDGWTALLERAIRSALRAGIGLKELKTLVPELATGIALTETEGAAAAARLLQISRRAVDYRRAETSPNSDASS